MYEGIEKGRGTNECEHTTIKEGGMKIDLL